MGSWTIAVKGHGAHHNGLPDDADKLAADFAKQLAAAGHTVDSATLALDGGGVTDLVAVPVPKPTV